MTIYGIFSGSWDMLSNAIFNPPDSHASGAQIAAGLAIVLWNYCGWDNTSTYASDVENPQRNYPRTLAVALFIIILSYVFPMLAGFKATVNPADWSESAGWPTIATKLGGHWLGMIGAICALVSAWALFNSQLLYVSRLPSVMARDGWLPRRLGKVSKRTGAPVNALLAVAAASVVFSLLSLSKLMVMDILLYTLGLSLEFAALIALRIREPGLKRPFRVPLGHWGLAAMAVPPLALAVTVAVTSTMGEDGSLMQVGLIAVVLVLGVVIYRVRGAQLEKRSDRPQINLKPKATVGLGSQSPRSRRAALRFDKAVRAFFDVRAK
jgi:amino acid transporter